MTKALWNGTVIAESDKCQEVEGNLYFPSEALRAEYFTDSTTSTVCVWKGTARYFDVVVDGAINPDAAWYYPDTKSAADHIKNSVAFWRGVKVER